VSNCGFTERDLINYGGETQHQEPSREADSPGGQGDAIKPFR